MPGPARCGSGWDFHFLFCCFYALASSFPFLCGRGAGGPHRCHLLAPWGEENRCDQRGALWPWHLVPLGTAPLWLGGTRGPEQRAEELLLLLLLETGRLRRGERGVLGRGAVVVVCPVPRRQLSSRGCVGGQQGPPVPPPAAGTVPDPRPLGAQEHRAALIALWRWAVPAPLRLLPVRCFPPSLSPSPLPEIASEGRAVRPHPGRRWRGAGADLQARRPSRYVLPEVLGACRGRSLPREEHSHSEESPQQPGLGSDHALQHHLLPPPRSVAAR